MADSLQDQLLKAGIINKQKAGKVNAEKRKKNKQLRQSKAGVVDADKLAVQQARSVKAKKDRQLNQQRQQQLESKAKDAQIRQLISNHHQVQDDAEIAYNFTDDKIIKKIYVTESVRDQISKGKLAIVKFDSRYEVIPASIALKIDELSKNHVIVMNDSSKDDVTEEDDAYAGYDVPSDLIW